MTYEMLKEVRARIKATVVPQTFIAYLVFDTTPDILVVR
jgi:hypothetical protein